MITRGRYWSLSLTKLASPLHLLIEKMIVAQLVKKLAAIKEPDDSLACSQHPAKSIYPEPDEPKQVSQNRL